MYILEYLLNCSNYIFSIFDYDLLFWSIYDNYLPLTSQLILNSCVDFWGSSFLGESFLTLLLSFDTILIQLINFIGIVNYFNISTTTANAICTAIKFILCISFLIFSRGGIPRFRYDYLTKLGWIRFLSLVLLSFCLELYILSML